MPTIHEYVQAYLTSMRAPLREKTYSTVAGTTLVRERGEAILYGPNGEPIRVIENPEGGNIIEHGDHQHVVVRAQPVQVGVRT